MTSKFSRFGAVVKEHIRAEFHPAKCSGTEKEKLPKTLQSVAAAPTVKLFRNVIPCSAPETDIVL